MSLLDIDDVEKFCRRIIQRRIDSEGGSLRPDRYEALLTYLVETAWELSQKHDPLCRTCRGGQTWMEEDGGALVERGPVDVASCKTCGGRGTGRPFSYWAFDVLTKRIVDWYRSTIVDIRYGEDCAPCGGTGRDDSDDECVYCLGSGKVRRGEEVPLSNLPAFYHASDVSDAATLVDGLLPADALGQLTVADFSDDVVDALSPLPAHIDRRQIPPRTQWILLEVVQPIVAHDLSYEEVAKRYEYSRPWVARQISVARSDLRQLQEAA